MLVEIKDDVNWEYNEVESIASNTLTMVNNLQNTYTTANNGKVWIDLIEKTDTTYTLLEYENSPVFDVLKYVAGSVDKSGVIGYDFRVAPDSLFEFFPVNSKTCSVDLAETIELSQYTKDIHRIRNRIITYGAPEKAIPLDKDVNTESLTPNGDNIDTPDGTWSSGTGSGEVNIEASEVIVGSFSVEHNTTGSDYYGCLVFTFGTDKEVNGNLYPSFYFQIQLEEGKNFDGNLTVLLKDNSGNEVYKETGITPGKWSLQNLAVGKDNTNQWTHNPSNSSDFDWTDIKHIVFYAYFAGTGTGKFYVDNMFFNHRRWEARRPLEGEEPTSSQTTYGLRELVEVDEELHSDNECDLRAKALREFLENPAEYLVIDSTVIDYGTTPILAGDKIHVTVPNENIDADFRVVTAEYRVNAETQELGITLELGNTRPQLADYIYGLRSTTITAEKLMRTKAGKQGAIGGSGGSGTGGAIPDWITSTFFGPISDTEKAIYFRTRNAYGDAAVNHKILPTDDDNGEFGSDTNRFKSIHVLRLYDVWRVFCSLIPDGSYDLGDANNIWNAIHANWINIISSLNIGGVEVINSSRSLNNIPYADLGLLNIGGTEVISSARVLHNVEANANIITSGTFDTARIPNLDATKITTGRFPVDRMPTGTAGYFLKSYGAGVNPNFQPLAAGDILSGRFSLSRLPEGTSGYFLKGFGAGVDPAFQALSADDILSGRFSLDRLPTGTGGYFLKGNGIGVSPNFQQISAGDISGGYNGDIDVAKVGGGTRTLHFWNGICTGYTDP